MTGSLTFAQETASAFAALDEIVRDLGRLPEGIDPVLSEHLLKLAEALRGLAGAHRRELGGLRELGGALHRAIADRKGSRP